MIWWHKALIGTATLIVLMTIGVALMLRFIEANAESASHVEAWTNKLAKTSGLIAGFGLVTIWGFF